MFHFEIKRKKKYIFRLNNISLAKNGCQLQELTVFLYNNANKMDKESKQLAVDSLQSFLASQNQLETLIFGNPLYGDDIRLLTAAATKSGTTLQTLHCIFFDDEDSKGSQATFCSSLDQMPQLQKGCFSLQSLRAEEVKILNNMKDCKRLTLYDLGPRHDVTWENENLDLSPWPLPEWKQGIKIHPVTEEELGGEYWIRCSHHPSLKLPLKPITYMNVQFRCEDSDGINTVLSSILKNYSETLVSLNVADSVGFGREDEMIRDIVQSCKALRELNANTFLSIGLLEFICEKQERNEIELLNLYFKVGSTETRDAVNDIMKRHGNLMSTRNWEYDTSFSMEGLEVQEAF